MVGGGGLGHTLLFERPLDLEDPVTEPRGFLKLLALGGGRHLCPQLIQQFSVPSLQELPHLLDDLVVLVARLVPDAGSHAALELIFDAGSLGLAVYLDLAGGQREDLANHF